MLKKQASRVVNEDGEEVDGHEWVHDEERVSFFKVRSFTHPPTHSNHCILPTHFTKE